VRVCVCLSVCQPIMQKAEPTRRACVLEGRRQEKFFHVLRHCDGSFFFLVHVISGRDSLSVVQQRFPAFSHVFLFVSISFSPYININCVPCLGNSHGSHSGFFLKRNIIYLLPQWLAFCYCSMYYRSLLLS
jgi:hypothetical protein